MIVDVEHQVLPHDGKPDHPEIRALIHLLLPFSRIVTATPTGLSRDWR